MTSWYIQALQSKNNGTVPFFTFQQVFRTRKRSLCHPLECHLFLFYSFCHISLVFGPFFVIPHCILITVTLYVHFHWLFSMFYFWRVFYVYFSHVFSHVCFVLLFDCIFWLSSLLVLVNNSNFLMLVYICDLIFLFSFLSLLFDISELLSCCFSPYLLWVPFVLVLYLLFLIFVEFEHPP